MSVCPPLPETLTQLVSFSGSPWNVTDSNSQKVKERGNLEICLPPNKPLLENSPWKVTGALLSLQLCRCDLGTAGPARTGRWDQLEQPVRSIWGDLGLGMGFVGQHCQHSCALTSQPWAGRSQGGITDSGELRGQSGFLGWWDRVWCSWSLWGHSVGLWEPLSLSRCFWSS